MPEHPLSPQMRSLISRLTLLVITIVLAYASYRCITVALSLFEEARQIAAREAPSMVRRRRSSGGEAPMLIGALLGLLSFVTGLGAVMPWRFFERFARSPGTPNQRVAAPRDYFKV